MLIHVKPDISADEFLGELTDAVYRVALDYQIKGPVDAFRRDIQEALRGVMQRGMFVTGVCGLLTTCREAEWFEPWSREAEEANR